MSRTASRTGTPYPPELKEVLAWLGAPPADDPLNDLAPLRRHLLAIAGLPAIQHLKILELFQTRANLAGSTVKPRLLDAALPLTAHRRSAALGLMNIHEALAAGYHRILRAAPEAALTAAGYGAAQLSALGLSNLSQEYEIAQLAAAPAPADFWELAQTFFRGLQSVTVPNALQPNTPAAAESTMKAMLALAAAQPEGFSPREGAFLADYLRVHAAAVDIRDATHSADANDYWIDPAHGLPPAAAVCRPPARGAGLRFSCVELSHLARQHVARLEKGEHPETFGLGRDALTPDYRSVLERAAARWAHPPKRQTRRRRHGYRVLVCAHLGPLWQQSGATDAPPPTSEWMIINESPRGYAIMHVAGELAGLVAGSAIAMRSAADRPWNICVVRWARSENPEHLELGLELVTPLAHAVRIARHGAGSDLAPIPALLLPPLPRLNRGEALLTARGCFAPGPFSLIDESSGRLRLTECMATRLPMHTAYIEVFEFERTNRP